MAVSSSDRFYNELLDGWQRALPLVERPFLEIGNTIGLPEADVIARLSRLQASGVVARVGGVVRPNTLGASTLAAISVPDLDVDGKAAILCAEPGINHVYLRENDWNLWFVVTGPDRPYVDAAIAKVEGQTGDRVLDLRLERPYHIDLGFPLSGEQVGRHDLVDAATTEASRRSLREGDRQLVQELVTGLPLIAAPFREIASRLGRAEGEVIARTAELCEAGVLSRIGVIVRHRALGWRSNAMVVWDVDPSGIDRAGAALAKCPGINLCYRRTRYESEWPYNLYCMIHAKSRDMALRTLVEASAAAGLDGVPRQILFSLRCFKQTGALVAASKEAA
ncbi:MAG: Lrp/AsnC family transcriptional regulator [Alphaproteobacteria bacterium]|nr:Lrp/AsnC family transcriptional regulator [Alphaproteobacteria bacterium]